MTTTECTACTALARIGSPVQCDRCRAERPNAWALRAREIARLVREDGLTVADAEASVGARAVVVN